MEEGSISDHESAEQRDSIADAPTEEEKPSDQPDGAPVLSNNQKKRMQRIEARRQIQKQRKDDKKRQRLELRQAQEAAEPSVLDPAQEERAAALREERKRQQELDRQAWEDKCESGPWIVIDCAWEKDMNDREMTSLAQQIMFCYGCNKRAPHPFKMHVSSAGPRLQQQFQKLSGVSAWRGFSMLPEPYNSLSEHRELVYLTADGEETLTSIDDDKAYVIGGIVDRNRLKNATFDKAKAENIRTMKLPLREHVHLQGTSVLTVNHVVEIMLKFRSTNSWREAFNVLPGRKMVGNSDVASDEDDHTAAVAPEGVEHEGKEDSDL